MDAALLSLAIYATVTVLRTVYEFATARNMVTPVKVFLVVLVAGPLAACLANKWEWSTLVLTLAGIGGATVVHRLHRLLGAAGDYYRLQFMQGDVRRHRP